MKSKKSLDKSKSSKGKSKDKKDKSLDKSKSSKKSSKSKDKEKKEKKPSKEKSKKNSKSGPVLSNKESKDQILNENLQDNQSISGIHKENLDGFDFTGIQDINNKNTNQPLDNPPFSSTILPPDSSKKCEGCFHNPAVLYCEECNKLLCSMCDGQIHVIPVNSTHTKVPLNEIGSVKRLCYHHREPLSLYCNSCEEVICKQCQIIGPHNTNFHRIVRISDAFERKFTKLVQLKPALQKKLAELSVHNNKIGDLIEKLNNTRTNLIRDIRAQYSQLSQKIKNVEGKREAVLAYETMELQADLNAINDNRTFINDIQENKDSDIINFLVQYYQLDARMDAIIDKNLKEKINSEELERYPNELEERHKTIADYDKMQELLEERNKEIMNVIKEKKDRESSLLQEAKESAAQEIQSWVKKSSKLEDELKKFKVVCAFCGKYLDKNIANSECEANANFYLNFYFTKETPEEEFLNTKRHFFGEPVANSAEKMKTAEVMWREQREEIQKQKIFEQMKKEEEKRERIKMQRQSGVNINASTNGNNRNNDIINIHVTSDNNPFNVSQASNKDLLMSATNGFNTSIKFDKNNQKVNLNILTDSQPNIIQKQDD